MNGVGRIVSFWTDIARTAEPPRAADALYAQFPGKDLFLVCEAGEATGSAAQLVPLAAGAIVTGIAASNATSASRILDQALESANRTIADAKRFNPLVADVLVSVSVVLRDGQGLHYATVGANAIYLRTEGTCRRINEPESEARHLVSEGITADPLPGSGEEASRPSVGLGLPPEVFRVRQSGSLLEPDDYLLVIVGGRAACRLGPVHIETTSPVGDSSRTAERLLRQAGIRPDDGSAVCAAHRAHDVVVGDGQAPRALGPEPEPLHIPWKAIGGAAAVVLLIGLAVYLWSSGRGEKNRRDPVLAPTTLLAPKLEGSDLQLPGQGRSPGVVDTGIPRLDMDLTGLVPTPDVEVVTSEPTATDVVDPVAAEAAAREAKAVALHKEARARRREKRRLERAAKAKAEAEAEQGRDTETPDVNTQTLTGDVVVQVMDFTLPEPDAQGEDAGPTRRPFPVAKLELPDVVSASQPETLPEPPDGAAEGPSYASPDATETPAEEPAEDEIPL